MSEDDGIGFWMGSSVDEDEINREITSDTEDNPKEKQEKEKPKNETVTRASAKQNSQSYIDLDTESDDDDVTPVGNGTSNSNVYSRNQSHEDSIASRTRGAQRIAEQLYRSNVNFQNEVDLQVPQLKVIPESDPQSAALLRTQKELMKELEDLEKDIDDVGKPSKQSYVPNVIEGSDDEDVIVDDSDPNRKKILFKTSDDTFEWHLVWDRKSQFFEVINKLPPKYWDYDIIIDGTTWKSSDVFYDLVHNGDVLVITEPKVPSTNAPGMGSHSQGGEDGMRKISFLMPDGSKKKTKVSLDSTWREALEKLGVGTSLLFDGDELDLDEKIGDNPDIEDEDQIDVNE